MIRGIIFRPIITILVLQSGLDKYCHGGRFKKSETDGLSKYEDIVANFSARYFGELFQGISGKSVVTSPLASLISLAPLAIYSQGDTHQEIANVLAMDKRTIKRILPSIIKLLGKDQNGATLELSVSIFFNNNLNVSNKFNKTTKKITGSRPRSINFIDVEQAAEIVNGWVSNKTHHTIKYVIKPDMLSSKTTMIVVNTLFFKNSWDTAFRTREKMESFYGTSGEKEMQFMHDVGKFEYTNLVEIDSQVVVKRYNNSKFACTIILPSSRSGLPEVVKKIMQGNLLRDILQMKFISHPVEVILPVISIENSLDIIPISNEMGIKRAYTDSAEFKHILRSASNRENIKVKVSQIVQGLKFAMNQNGTQGAINNSNQTEYNLTESFMFRADHPFMFIVSREDLVLFIGCFNP